MSSPALPSILRRPKPLYALALLVAIIVLFTTLSTTSYSHIVQQHLPQLYDRPPQTSSTTPSSSSSPSSETLPAQAFNGTFDFARDHTNLFLTRSQCRASFASLFTSLDATIASRQNDPITPAELSAVPDFLGSVRGYIYDGQIYILSTGAPHHTRAAAIVQSLHLAVRTSPFPIPNMPFLLATVDNAPSSSAIWSFSRPSPFPPSNRIWIIPDFGFFSWPEPHVGAYRSSLRSVLRLEAHAPSHAWANKHAQLLWRGADLGIATRLALLDRADAQPWSAVRRLNWSDPQSRRDDLLTMPQHCAYRFLAQTEGFGSSGRLKHLHNCRSVVLSPQPRFEEHWHSLLRAEDEFPGEANYVRVKDDWSDLHDVMARLLADEAWAQGVADRSVRDLREGGLTEAAQMCYWREMLSGWAASVQGWGEAEVWEADGDGGERMKGVSVEDWVLLGKTEWEAY